jgi:hypothetical protein
MDEDEDEEQFSPAGAFSAVMFTRPEWIMGQSLDCEQAFMGLPVRARSDLPCLEH